MDPTTTDQPPGTSPAPNAPAGSDDHPKTPATTVYVCNLSEDVWPFIAAMSDDKVRANEIDQNANLCDRHLFSMAQDDHILFISPRPISPKFLQYYQQVVKDKDISVVVTQTHSGLICDDIIHDQAVMAAIVKAANSTKRLTLESYSTSPQFLNLVQTLRQRGLTIYTPEAPEIEDGWTVNFYGSKSGIRQLAQQSSNIEPDLRMPPGLICTNIADAAKIAAKIYLKEDGVVVKTNKGHAGAGLLIFRPGDLPQNYFQCAETILTSLQKDAYWDRFPIIIEEYIASNPAVGGGFPNVEFKVLKTGEVKYLYYGGMRITKNGVFRGMEVNNDAVSDQVAAQMIDTGFFIGERYAQAGYRGYFDIDFIAAKNGKLFVTESNVRRTGVTHAYNTAMKLFGKDFMYETYMLTDDGYPIKNSKHQVFTDLLQTINPILFNHKTKEGVVIASENLLAQKLLSYIVFGKTKKRSLEIESQLESLLNS